MSELFFSLWNYHFDIFGFPFYVSACVVGLGVSFLLNKFLNWFYFG